MSSFTHDTSRLARAYDRLSDSQFESGKRLIERLGVKEGDRVLDVGCGTGRLAEWIAERVGPRGSVTGLDPLPERVALARARAGRVPFEEGRAEDLGAFADESFDVVCLSAVLHWVSDKPKAFAEIRRVLRPGGRVGVTTLVRELLAASGVSAILAPILGRPPYAQRVELASNAIAKGHTTTELISLVVESGLELSELHVVERMRAHANGDELVDFLEASSFGNFLRMVPDELRESLRADLAAGFEEKRGEGGIEVRDFGAVFVAKKPKPP